MARGRKRRARTYTAKPDDLREGDRRLNGPVVVRQMTPAELEAFRLRKRG